MLSCVRLFATPWTAARQASLSITNSRSLLKFLSIQSVMLSNHLILSSPSPPAFNLFQHQGLFQRASSNQSVLGLSIVVSASASVLPMNIQNLFPLEWTGLISLQSKGPSRVLSSITIRKYQFLGAQPRIWSNLHPCLTAGKL